MSDSKKNCKIKIVEHKERNNLCSVIFFSQTNRLLQIVLHGVSQILVSFLFYVEKQIAIVIYRRVIFHGIIISGRYM